MLKSSVGQSGDVRFYPSYVLERHRPDLVVRLKSEPLQYSLLILFYKIKRKNFEFETYSS
jgi:hypothetical protein